MTRTLLHPFARAAAGVALVTALCSTSFAGPSAKDRAAAKAHIERATTAHDSGQFETARTELEAAYALDPQPDLLYALGQVHVKLGKCDVAVTYYERYLATKPGPEPAQAATEAINNCKQQLDAEEAARQPVAVTTAPTTTSPMTTSDSGTGAHTFDYVGAGLVGAGVVSTVVGIVMYTGARGDLDDAENAATYDESNSLVDDAHSKRTYAVVFGVVGVAAIGVGTWHYLRHRKTEHASSGVSIAPMRDGGGLVTWGGSF